MHRSPLRLGLICLALVAAFSAGCAAQRGLLPAAQAPEIAGGAGPAPAPAMSLRDLGERPPSSNVRVAIVLRFNNEAELERLVDEISDPASGSYRHFLTREAFEARFAPLPAVRAKIIGTLRRAGFSIENRGRDATLVVANATVRSVERLFHTRVHDFDQGRLGRGYANVEPLNAPAAIAPYVEAIDVNSVVLSRQADVTDVEPATFNHIRNHDFEQHQRYWRSCDTVIISTDHPYSGKYSALVGSANKTSGSPKGLQALCQQVKVPNRATLAARLYYQTNVTKATQGYQTVGLMSEPGKILKVLRKDVRDGGKWSKAKWDLSDYAGQTVYVYFGVWGKGQKTFYDQMYVDDVALESTAPTPTPSGSPTPTPTPSPVGTGPGQPLDGPAFGTNAAWAPRAVADAFDLPVQHGFDGRKAKVAIVTQSTIAQSDLTAFLNYNGIHRSGSLETVPIDGGPTNGDPTETTLDVETIGALAPGADIALYAAPNLSNISVLNAYSAALKDNRVVVVTSSFGQCDSADHSFDRATDHFAVEGAAIGVTFIAAAGDFGSACYNGNANVIGVQAPASNPHFLSVGGSESLAPAFAGSSPCPCKVERAESWDDHNANFGGLTGGGVSSFWPLPKYQQHLTGKPASLLHRNVPDLEFPAVDNDLFYGGIQEVVDGTSWSASIAAATIAQGYAICGRFGYVNPAVYKTYATDAAESLIDVVKGFNGKYVPKLPQGYHAAAGYDNVSGVGMPRGFQFVKSLCGRTSQ